MPPRRVARSTLPADAAPAATGEILMHPPVCVVGNDKGGVGKDLVAEGLYLAALRAGLQPSLIEVEVARRLGQLYPAATYIAAGATSPEELYRDPDRAFAPLDEMAIACRKPGQLGIVCLGANLTGALQMWSRTNGQAAFGDGAGICFAIVLTMNRGALASGLANLYELGRLYPAARRVAVLNESVADFIQDDRNLAKRLTQARGEGTPIETVRIRRMAAPAWGYLQSMGPLAEVAQKRVADLVELGLPEGPSVRSLALFERWLADDLISSLAMLLPAGAPAKVQAATA